MFDSLYTQNIIALYVALFLQLFFTLISCLLDPYIGKRDRKLMMIIILLVFSLLITQELGECFAYGNMVQGRLVTSIYDYTIRPVIIVCFMQIVNKDKRPWVLVALNTLVFLTALFSNVAFTITEDNTFVRGPLGFTCHLISFVLLIWLLCQVIVRYKHKKNFIMIMPFLIVIAIMVSAIIDSFFMTDYRVGLLLVTMVTSCVTFYIWLHLQFVREHEEDLKAQQRIKIMMSQIQPHFMYNTLSTIQALCLNDPELASETTGKFGSYLRQNIESLSHSDLIPFEKELEHTETYAEIEMVRFPNIRIDYDTEDTEFDIPALSIQPLVENAIRHGVRIRKSGVVRVISRKYDDYHEIIVQDNGKGFDVDSLRTADSSHIGIRNVKERIEKLCDGTLTIDSKLDEGTTITIHIPIED